jgi:phage terminase large subunit-like protein
MDDYIKRQHEKVNEYVQGVRSGRVIANHWIKLSIDRYLSDLKRKDIEYRTDKIERVFFFFSLLRININNTYRQFELQPWQAFVLANMFGFYFQGTDKRKYRYSFIFVSRKSGKTVFAAAIQLYGLIADGEIDPQSLLLASTREQASIALDYAKSIVINSPALVKQVERQQYRIIYNRKGSRGLLKTVASNANRLDGYSPSMCVLDEIHSYPDDSLFRVIKSGILARKNPMVMLISTAGFNVDSFCFDLVETCKGILSGNITDDSMFCMLYMLDDDDDYNNPDVWIKSNPAIGTIIALDDMVIEYNQAKNRTSELPNFLTKNLNLFVNSTIQWITDDVLRSNFVQLDESEFYGCDCYMGMDLSSTRDLTALVRLFEKEGRFYAFADFFFAKNPEKRIRKAGIDLSPWIKKGYITECQTSTIDYDLIFNRLEELSGKFNIVSLAYDKFNSALIIPKIEELGIDCIPFEQTAKRFNFPLKYLEKQMYDGTIDHAVNPVLLWNFRNIVLYVDGNGNIKILKNKSLDSVDGAVAEAMAFGAYVEYNIDEERLGLSAFIKQSQTST